ncbi:PREDICTED: uncharacterized protein LOC104719217 [Camelina sativa]|uniref:Uncharacterized protein LOC104719217 n=1 Tax=Camelina sativa TaxID=90675 RepID=A0ABM1QI48_CAMSA|nr:PREDICTED: uncharacterized protein LOC104719217 [Camelina sativa]XP_019086436.1 PREDICTED: uncharacterized protein LOC104719217 [Camelina sativa]
MGEFDSRGEFFMPQTSGMSGEHSGEPFVHDNAWKVPNSEAASFFDRLNMASEPLDDNCVEGLSKFSLAADVMHIKPNHNLAETCVDDVSQLIHKILPEGLVLITLHGEPSLLPSVGTLMEHGITYHLFPMRPSCNGGVISSFYWDDAIGGEVYYLWYHVIAGRLRDMISKAKNAGTKPEWISGEIWETMQEYWGTDAARKNRKIARDNRMSCRDGFGPHAHTDGSRSYDQLRELIRQKEGIEPSMLRILRETHRKANGTYVDDKARSIEEEIQ